MLKHSKYIILVNITLWLLVCGCNSGRLPVAAVSGKLVVDGKPVEGAKVLFTPTSGRAATGVTDADGSFTLTTYRQGDGAVVGRHSVLVFGSGRPDVRSGKIDVDRPPTPSAVPLRYANPSTSDLSVEIMADKTNQVHLELTAKPAKPNSF